MQRSLLAVTLLCWKSEVSLIFTFIKSSQESHEWRFAESNLQIHSNISASLLILAFCNVLHPVSPRWSNLPVHVECFITCHLFSQSPYEEFSITFIPDLKNLLWFIPTFEHPKWEKGGLSSQSASPLKGKSRRRQFSSRRKGSSVWKPQWPQMGV